MTAARVRMLLVTLWVGSLWTIGYVVAPALFATLADRALAGTIAGKLFRIEAWISVACAVTLLALFVRSKDDGDVKAGKQHVWIVLGMLACTLIGYFGFQPFMAALREVAASGAMDADAKARFGLLHGISSGFYFIQSLLGGLLVWKLR